MERRLYKAAAEGDVASLLNLLKEDPLILDRCTVWPYDETPLHVAAMLGHEKFVDEILDRKAELAGELDSWKLSPLHLAAAKGYLGVVKKLLSVNADMCYTCDKYGRNPLHVAAVKGRVDVLKELVQECPDAARRKMKHGETILHLCVKHSNFEGLKLLVETVGDREFVNSKNDEGDTILHLAAACKQTETIDFLKSCTPVEANSLNGNGLAADDLLEQSGIEPVTTMALLPNANDQRIAFPVQQKGSKKKVKKQYDWLERKKSALMVVASLTATMAFQVGVNPPGGFWQENKPGNATTNPQYAGHSILADNNPVGYTFFLAVNTIGFLASLSVILLLMSGLPLRRRFFTWILMVIMWIAITSIAYTYGLSIAAFSIADFTPPHQKNSINLVLGFGIFAWSVLMVLLLAGHTIRLMRRATRKVKKIFTRSSPASLAMNQDSV